MQKVRAGEEAATGRKLRVCQTEIAKASRFQCIKGVPAREIQQVHKHRRRVGIIQPQDLVEGTRLTRGAMPTFAEEPQQMKDRLYN